MHVVDLRSLAQDLYAAMRRVAGERAIVVLSVAPTLGRVFADRSQIECIVVNLVAKALDAMPAGGTITLELANAAAGDPSLEARVQAQVGPHVRLTVRGTSTPADESVPARAAHQSLDSKPAGEGACLDVTDIRSAVQQLGGSISVHGGQGEETAFDIYLPRTDRAETASSRPPPPPRASSAPPPSQAPAESDPERDPELLSGTETVLVVEDQEPLRAVVVRILGEQGYSVIEARNPTDALELCKGEGHIDLLLTDVVMPEMNGRDLAQRVLQLRPGLPVLFMSGYTGTAIAPNDALEARAQLLNKPFTAKELLRMVRRALR
jgi:CheY-like chemotaxis protein